MERPMQTKMGWLFFPSFFKLSSLVLVKKRASNPTFPARKGYSLLSEFLPISIMSPAFTGYQTRHNCLS